MAAQTIEVLPIGTKVKIAGDIQATVRAVTIYSEHWIKYLCVWWDERERKEEWLMSDEVDAAATARVGIAFQRS
ncbi:MAG TPA: hypothetical protein VIW64_08825 [Pyrinomonadaceae bacterium]